MDREDKAVAWSDLTDSAAVSAILSQAGLVPDVETTQAGHFELKHTLIQRETGPRVCAHGWPAATEISSG